MPEDVDREFVMVYHAVDENHSPYLRANVYSKITRPALLGGAAASNVVRGQVPFGKNSSFPVRSKRLHSLSAQVLCVCRQG